MKNTIVPLSVLCFLAAVAFLVWAIRTMPQSAQQPVQSGYSKPGIHLTPAWSYPPLGKATVCNLAQEDNRVARATKPNKQSAMQLDKAASEYDVCAHIPRNSGGPGDVGLAKWNSVDTREAAAVIWQDIDPRMALADQRRVLQDAKNLKRTYPAMWMNARDLTAEARDGIRQLQTH